MAPGKSEGEHEPRPCVACGYDLFGLGDELRCPECGLRNIPEALRQDVWAFVDRRSWFYSGMFRVFAKRPPGWWWALDRDGDVRSSFRYVARNLLTSALLIALGTAICHSVSVVVTVSYSGVDATGKRVDVVYFRYGVGPLGGMRDYGDTSSRDVTGVVFRPNPPATFSSRVEVEPSWAWIVPSVFLTFWVCMSWATPALVGIWTQIRKGLPEFARAPRTIVAAANLESHRTVYVAAAVALVCVAETAARVAWSGSNRAWYDGVGLPMVFGVVLFAAAGWVGPLRSDYTRQLIRSPWHACRIVVMYAVVLPILLALALEAIVFGPFMW